MGKYPGFDAYLYTPLSPERGAPTVLLPLEERSAGPAPLGGVASDGEVRD